MATGGFPARPHLADDRFAHSFLEEAQLAPAPRPAQPQNSGRLRQSLHLLRHSPDPRLLPQPRGRCRSSPGRGFVAAGAMNWSSPASTSAAGPRSAPRRRRAEAQSGRPGPPHLCPHGPPPAPPQLHRAMDWDAELIALMAQFGGTRLARHAHLPSSRAPTTCSAACTALSPLALPRKSPGSAARRGAGPHPRRGRHGRLPAETDAEFEETLALIAALPFGYLHLFPFSPRRERPVGSCTPSIRAIRRS